MVKSEIRKPLSAMMESPLSHKSSMPQFIVNCLSLMRPAQRSNANVIKPDGLIPRRAFILHMQLVMGEHRWIISYELWCFSKYFGAVYDHSIIGVLSFEFSGNCFHDSSFSCPSCQKSKFLAQVQNPGIGNVTACWFKDVESICNISEKESQSETQ